MAATEFHYPNSGAPSISWQPGKTPLIDGTNEDEDTGIAALLAADNETLHAEQLSNPFSKYTFRFSGISPAAKAALISFALAVGGAAFDMSYCFNGSTISKRVCFAREGFRRTWLPESGGTYGVTVVLVDAT